MEESIGLTIHLHIVKQRWNDEDITRQDLVDDAIHDITKSIEKLTSQELRNLDVYEDKDVIG